MSIDPFAGIALSIDHFGIAMSSDYSARALKAQDQIRRIMNEDARVSTSWTSILRLRVNLPHPINFRALCGANLVTLPPGIQGGKTLVVHRMHGREKTHLS